MATADVLANDAGVHAASSPTHLAAGVGEPLDLVSFW